MRVGYADLLACSLPKTLRSLRLFEYHSQLLHPAWIATPGAPLRTGDLGCALWGAGHQLVEISVSFFIDAYDFFFHYQPAHPIVHRPWKNLQVVVLTAQDLRPPPDNLDASDRLTAADRVLFIAGRGAGHMPRLRVMELWNAGDNSQGELALFRYTNRIVPDPRSRWGEKPRISLQCTWPHDWQLHLEVMRAWSDVSYGHTRQYPEVVRSPFTKPDLKSKHYIHMISELAMSHCTLDELSSFASGCCPWQRISRY